MSIHTKLFVPLTLAASQFGSLTTPDSPTLYGNLFPQPSPITLSIDEDLLKKSAVKERQAYVTSALSLLKGGLSTLKGDKQQQVLDLLDATFQDQEELVNKLKIVNGYSKLRGLLLGEAKPEAPGVIDRSIAKRYGFDTEEKIKALNYQGVAIDDYFVVITIADLAGREQSAKETGIVDLMSMTQTGLRVSIDGPQQKDFRTGIPLPKALEEKWGQEEGAKMRDQLIKDFVELCSAFPGSNARTRLAVADEMPTLGRDVYWGPSKTEREFSPQIQKQIDSFVDANFEAFYKGAVGTEKIDEKPKSEIRAYYKGTLETAAGYWISGICPHSEEQSESFVMSTPKLAAFES